MVEISSMLLEDLEAYLESLDGLYATDTPTRGKYRILCPEILLERIEDAKKNKRRVTEIKIKVSNSDDEIIHNCIIKTEYDLDLQKWVNHFIKSVDKKINRDD